MSEKTRYPLCWPDGWKRTERSLRIRAQFRKEERNGSAVLSKSRLSVMDSIERVAVELGRMSVDHGNIIVSTNLPLNIYGQPRADRDEPGDPGVAIYWQRGKENKAMAIDRYDRVADNIAAIAATLEYMRGIERHGGGEILERVFSGFAQLPERAGGKGWREVLGFNETVEPTKEAIGSRFRELSKSRHPEAPGGSRDAFEELTWARDAAVRELSPAAEAAKP